MNASIAAILAMSEASRSQKSNGGKSGETATTPNAASPKTVILELNPNDVIQGRGTGTAVYEGNVKFRKLIKEYKEEYMSAETKRHMKAVIANNIFNEIRSRGGRFVRKEKKIKVQGVVINKEVYYELEEKVALEKCKQALRQLYGCENRSDGSSHRKRPVQPARKRTVQPTSTAEAPSLSHGEISSQLARLQMNQLRRLYALQRSKPSTIRARTTPPIDSSSARMILLRRAQIAAQEKADLYKQALMQLASEETIGAPLLPSVVGHLNPSASALRQATSSRPSLSPAKPRAVPESLLQDLAAYRLAKSRNECHHAGRPEAARTNHRIHSDRNARHAFNQSGTNDPSSEMFAREDAAAALSVLAMAAEHRTL